MTSKTFEIKDMLISRDRTPWIMRPHIACGLTLAALIAAICIAGCTGTRDTGSFTATGTVTHVELEGGFFGIVTDDGTRYLPLDLPEEYRTDGMRVTFTAVPAEDTATIQQWGTPIEITAIDEA